MVEERERMKVVSSRPAITSSASNMAEEKEERERIPSRLAATLSSSNKVEEKEEREGVKAATPSMSTIFFPVPFHVEPSSGGSWEVELDAPGCDVTVALTPDTSAYQHFKLPVPPMADKITIVSEADTGAQGQGFFSAGANVRNLRVFCCYILHFCISALGCLIHPQVWERFGVPSFPAPPANFSGITGQPLKVIGAGFLRVADPDHPDDYKQDRQLFYISSEGMDVGVTLSKSCCRNLGIIPAHFPMIGKADQEDEGKRLEEVENKLEKVKNKLEVEKKRRLAAEELLQKMGGGVGGGEVGGRRRRRSE